MVLERSHVAGLRAAGVIHPYQMQHAMNQKITKLVIERYRTPLCLSLCRLDRDDYVAKTGAPELDALSLEHGEGEHVGRAPRPTEAAGQLGDLFIGGEMDREFFVNEAQDA